MADYEFLGGDLSKDIDYSPKGIPGGGDNVVGRAPATSGGLGVGTSAAMWIMAGATLSSNASFGDTADGGTITAGKAADATAKNGGTFTAPTMLGARAQSGGKITADTITGDTSNGFGVSADGAGSTVTAATIVRPTGFGMSVAAMNGGAINAPIIDGYVSAVTGGTIMTTSLTGTISAASGGTITAQSIVLDSSSSSTISGGAVQTTTLDTTTHDTRGFVGVSGGTFTISAGGTFNGSISVSKTGTLTLGTSTIDLSKGSLSINGPSAVVNFGGGPLMVTGSTNVVQGANRLDGATA